MCKMHVSMVRALKFQAMRAELRQLLEQGKGLLFDMTDF